MNRLAYALVCFSIGTSFAVIGCKRGGDDDYKIVKPKVSSLDSCNYFANQGFEFRKGRWNEWMTPEQLSDGRKPGYIVFITDSLMSFDNDHDNIHRVFKMNLFRCSNLSFYDDDSTSASYKFWIQRGVFYDDSSKFLYLTSSWFNIQDTTLYLKP